MPERPGLCDAVRERCAAIACSARSVHIDETRLGSLEPEDPPPPDPELHHLDGEPADVALFVLCIDAINFGSGWFPTLRKDPGRSGYETTAGALTRHFREHGPIAPARLRELEVGTVATMLGQAPDHELMALYTRALRDLGTFIGTRGALDIVAAADGSAQRLATQLVAAMALYADPGFYKRAQITANDLALAGLAEFSDLDRLTIFADNVLPHVLHVDGVLVYDADLERRIDAGVLLEPGREERELRACAVHACELISQRTGVPPRVLDGWLWHRGRAPRYKARPRHRTRTTAY